MQGLFINGSRPSSKKAVKEQVQRINDYLILRRYAEEGQVSPDEADYPRPDSTNDPYSLVIEATSLHGNEFDGSLAGAQRRIDDPEDPMRDLHVNFVGPDPYTNRKFYGTITYNTQNQKWMVK